MSNSKVNFDGCQYPLGHLRGLRVAVPAKDPLLTPAKLQVTFSHHVYSEKWDETRHRPNRRIEIDGEVRAFCPVRYGCSIQLPDLIKYHVAGKALKDRDGKGVWNYFFHVSLMVLLTLFTFVLAELTGSTGLMESCTL